MKSAVKTSLLVLFSAAFLAACRPDPRHEKPDTPASSSNTPPAVPPRGATPEDVFRRAFWRHPAPADRILHAERREQPAPSGSPDAVQSWSWFIELRPSPELLAALRNPETFGLRPTSSPRPWPSEPAPPDWFPAPDALTDFEILQNPSGLTVLLRADTLYATDTGAGFASPIRGE